MMGMANTAKRYLCVLIILSAAAISGDARGEASLSGVATVIDGDTLESAYGFRASMHLKADNPATGPDDNIAAASKPHWRLPIGSGEGRSVASLRGRIVIAA
jgi:hypothetical protein